MLLFRFLHLFSHSFYVKLYAETPPTLLIKNRLDYPKLAIQILNIVLIISSILLVVTDVAAEYFVAA